MYKFIFVALFGGLLFSSCEKDPIDNPDDQAPNYMYHGHILSPNAAEKTFGDLLNITVQFESHSGEIVHNVSVEIKNVETGETVYSKPDQTHVNQSGGQYTFSESIYLNQENGFSPDSQWVLEASVWGAEPDAEKEIERVYFNIKP